MVGMESDKFRAEFGDQSNDIQAGIFQEPEKQMCEKKKKDKNSPLFIVVWSNV